MLYFNGCSKRRIGHPVKRKLRIGIVDTNYFHSFMARNLTIWKLFSSSGMYNIFHKPGSSPFHVPNPMVVRALLTSMGDLFLAVKWWFCWPTANGALMVIQLSLRTGVAQNCQEMKKPHVSFCLQLYLQANNCILS